MSRTAQDLREQHQRRARRQCPCNLSLRIYRFVAGEPTNEPHSKSREEKVTNSIGTGISEHSRAIARQLCEFERMEYQLELELLDELNKPEFHRYHQIFDRFQVPNELEPLFSAEFIPLKTSSEKVSHLSNTSTGQTASADPAKSCISQAAQPVGKLAVPNMPERLYGSM